MSAQKASLGDLSFGEREYEEELEQDKTLSRERPPTSCVINLANLQMSPEVKYLAEQIFSCNPANQVGQYLKFTNSPFSPVYTTALGNLSAGSSDLQLGYLIDRWITGSADEPTSPYHYANADGGAPLFGTGGPSYKDVDQGGVPNDLHVNSFGVVTSVGFPV